jgi:acyl-coenzyme A thioesterase PaaI-like protein
MFPDVRQSNLGNVVHGGAILTFVDMAMFAGGYAAAPISGRR